MDMNRLFILNLKKWRKITGLSQEKLAEKCNTAHSYIRQIECGNRHPSFAFIGKLADALQIEPYQLFYDETAKKGHAAQAKRLKSIQTKLIETVSGDIQAAFNEVGGT
jgi:transcriptional regulator with XRE-family HTH domain